MITAIQETRFSPAVKIISAEHRIVIIGQSRLEDPAPFFEELIAVLYKGINECRIHVSIDFTLQYMNSSSSKWLLHLLKGIQKDFQGKKLITINWYYDEEDDGMLEAGEVFQSLLTLPFNLLVIS